MTFRPGPRRLTVDVPNETHLDAGCLLVSLRAGYLVTSLRPVRRRPGNEQPGVVRYRVDADAVDPASPDFADVCRHRLIPWRRHRRR